MAPLFNQNFLTWSNPSINRGFDPSTIVDLKFWLDADDSSTITLSGSEITQWNDKSSNAFVFTPTSSTQRPTLETAVQNGKNVSRFVGSTSDELLSNVNSGLSGNGFALTFFVVFNKATNQNNMTLLGQNPSSTTHGLSFQVSTLQPAIDQWAPHGAKMDASISNSTWYVLTIKVASWATQHNATMWLDGVSKTTSAYGVHETPSLTNAVFNVGSWDDTRTDMCWDGDIAEMILYDAALSDTDRVSVENYLKNKWGI